jgi:UDP-galactopyranose mutase
MFERILAHPSIDVRVSTGYDEVKGEIDHDHLVYTGPIDAFFDYRHGALPYRSLEFELHNVPTPDGGYLNMDQVVGQALSTFEKLSALPMRS